MSEVTTYVLMMLVVVLIALLVYVLSLVKSIQQEANLIRDKASLIHTQGEVQKEQIDNLDFSVKVEEITAGIAQSGDAIKGAMLGTLNEINFQQDIANITSASRAIHGEVADINKIFLDKQDAAGWAEIELETRLKDSFANVQIRKKVAKLSGIPDAHLQLNGGKILCIDSKFPSKSFKAMIPESEGGDGGEHGGSRVKPRRDFIEAIRNHFNKVATDYVRPDLGTTEVAYMYVASERIYHHMVNPNNAEECEIVRQGANAGVMLCSPSTLIANMHLVRIAEQAMGIAEKSEEILKGHIRLRQEFDTLGRTWSTLSNQISNAHGNRTKIQEELESVERTLNSLENLDLEEKD
ncbi:MAG: DNA recombination protein RmuC [Candidatus Poseidoniaceae archaeon]|nr:DNA recombination protein RmuC [Candidatus Poseidoniaceae archaeon]